jgi:hypothetical protein
MYRPVERFAVNIRQSRAPDPEPAPDGGMSLGLLLALVWACAAALLGYAGWLFLIIGSP